MCIRDSAGAGRDHRQLRAGHRLQPRLGRGAEPHQARRAAVAPRGDPAGHSGGRSLQRGAADRDPAVHRRQSRRSRPRRLHDPQRARRNPPYSRRRPRDALLHRAIAAGLDRSCQAGRLQPDRRRRDTRDHRAERAGRLRQRRRGTEPQGSADFRPGAGEGTALVPR